MISRKDFAGHPGEHGAAARSLIHEVDLAAVTVRAQTENRHAVMKRLRAGPEAITQDEQIGDR
jgi:hypothetical protein